MVVYGKLFLQKSEADRYTPNYFEKHTFITKILQKLKICVDYFEKCVILLKDRRNILVCEV